MSFLFVFVRCLPRIFVVRAEHKLILLSSTSLLSTPSAPVYISSTPSAPVPSPPDPQVWQQTEGQDEGNDQNVQQYQQHSKYECGCVFKVSDGPKGAIKRIYIGCPSERAATDTQASILEAAAHISRNLKTIAEFPSLDHAVVTNQLLDARCNVDLQAEDGPTPLHAAATHGHAAVTEKLIAARCNVDLQEKDGCTPLYLTALEGRAVVSMVAHNFFPRTS
jgi:ankyrin repeat protein